MTNKKSITLKGLILPNGLFVCVCIAMILVGGYMTNHYFQTHFPTSLKETNTICDISAFWSCDKASNSTLGSFLNVPTSVIAIIVGLFGLLVAFIGKEGFEKTLKTILLLNLVGCLAMGIYSLAALGGLCLMCTIYYALSALAVFQFFKYSEIKPSIDVPAGIAFIVIALIPSLILGYNVSSKKSHLSQRQSSFVDQFNKLESYGEAPFLSGYSLATATENFQDAPIKVILFSDFQCPFCETVAKQFKTIAKDYEGKINIQYMFYPLDRTCNSDMKGSLHPYACQAAYLAACNKEKFEQIHDYIFENQSIINSDNLKKWEKDFGLSGCFENKRNQDMVQQTLNAGKFYKLRSTPTMIINGKKIEGGLDTPVLKSILDSIIK